MKITYLGHACFLIEMANGVKILTDPYDQKVGYQVFDTEADIVTTSHKHLDHAYLEKVKSGYVLVDKEGEYEVRGVKIEGLKSFHDKQSGTKRGENIIFIFNSHFKLAHLGDLGQISSVVDALKGVDIMLIPVGGFYTIEPEEAKELVWMVKPKIVIPMHYKTQKTGFNIKPVDAFTKYFSYVNILKSDTLEIVDLPKETPFVYVLNHRG